jgi:hypothetical protein
MIMCSQAGRQAGRQIVIWSELRISINTVTRAEKQIDIKTDKYTDRRTRRERVTDRHTHTDKDI